MIITKTPHRHSLVHLSATYSRHFQVCHPTGLEEINWQPKKHTPQQEFPPALPILLRSHDNVGKDLVEPLSFLLVKFLVVRYKSVGIFYQILESMGFNGIQKGFLCSSPVGLVLEDLVVLRVRLDSLLPLDDFIIACLEDRGVL